MKITKGRLRQIIKEELARIRENKKEKLAARAGNPDEVEQEDFENLKSGDLDESVDIELVEED
tara:strand:- start:987 stop:1175 length:189 start_codon:yes stop_codon:yes gene_type:complete